MNEHSRSIDTRHHAIRQDYVNGEMRIGGVASQDNESDILTKYLQPPLHLKHTRELHTTPEKPSDTKTLSNLALKCTPKHTPQHNEDMHAFPPAFGEMILQHNRTHGTQLPLPHPPATCAHIQQKNVEKQPKTTRHRRRAKRSRKNRHNTGLPPHTKQTQTRRPNCSANCPPAPPYTDQDTTLPNGIPPPPQQDNKHKCDKQKGAAKKGAMKIGQRRHISILDNIQTESKNRHKNHRFEKFLTSTKKHTKSDTILRHLFRQLEPLVQNHIEYQLKTHQIGNQFFVQNPNFQNHTNSKLLDRQIRATFCLIQANVNRYIDLQIKRLNDHSTPLVSNQNIQQRCNGSRTGGSGEYGYPGGY
jgi:hypothetical protein